MSTVSIPQSPAAGAQAVPLSTALDAAGDTAILHVEGFVTNSGTNSVATPVSASAPLPVADAAVLAAVEGLGGLPSGASTATLQTAGNAALGAIAANTAAGATAAGQATQAAYLATIAGNTAGGATANAIALALSAAPPATPFGTTSTADVLGSSTATDGSAGNVVTRTYTTALGVWIDTFTYGANSAVNGNPTGISRSYTPYATAFTAALSASSVVENTADTLTVTPTGGAWPAGITLTPTVSGLACTATAGTAPFGTTPATFAITPTAIGSGTVLVTSSPVLTNSSGALPITSSAPPAETATINAPSGTFYASTAVALSGSLANGSTIYISAYSAGAEQLPRTAATVSGGSWSGSVTPTVAGATTFSAYASSTGGTALDTTGSVTVSAAPTTTNINSVVVGSNGSTITLTLSQAATLATVASFVLTPSDGITWTTPGTAATTFVGTLASTIYSGATVTYSTTNTNLTSPALTATASAVAVTNNSTQMVHALVIGAGGSGYGSIPDQSNFTPASLLDLRVEFNTSTYVASGSTIGALIYFWDGNHGYIFGVNPAGGLQLVSDASSGGSNGFTNVSSTAPISQSANSTFWVRATTNFATGIAQFFTSPDNATWTQLGANVTIGTGYVNFPAAGTPMLLGAAGSPNLPPAGTKIYAAQILTDSNLVLNAAFTSAAPGAATVTATSGQTVTIVAPAAIV